MESPYLIKIIPCDNGERFPLMVNRDDGMPHYHSCVYIATEIRTSGKQDATLKRRLQAIKFVYDWSLKYNIDLEKRFKAGEFLTLQEVDCLSQDIYCRADFILDGFTPEEEAPPRRTRQKVAHLESARSALPERTMPTVQAETAGTRLWYIREYLNWLAIKRIQRTRPSSPEYAALVAANDMMNGLITKRIPDGGDEQGDPKLGVDKETERRLLEVIDPKSPENPWRDMRVRVRNQLFMHLLLGLGLRRGEALCIKLQDITFSGQDTLVIHRSPNDKTDPRLHQPQVKTLGRQLPMSDGLAHLCREYIFKYRCLDLPPARSHEFLFVGIKSGKAMCIATADDIYKTLRKKVPGLPRELTHHAMRRTWNDRFSEKADENIRDGVWTIADEESVRKERMGWRPKSRMAERYSKRYIREKADEITITLQNKILAGPVRKDDSSE